LDGSGEVGIGIGKGGVAELGAAQTIPADVAGGGWCPLGLVCWRRFRIDLKQQFGTTAEGFRERPFALLGEVAEFAEQLFGDLKLGLGPEGDCLAPSK